MVIFEVKGRDFKPLITYLMHDKRSLEQKEQGVVISSSERVHWVHTHNLGGIEDLNLVGRLLWETAQYSERCQKPVYHLSLNWHPNQPKPSQAHMIEQGEALLKHMKLDEHQVLMVAHSDTAHPHMHMVINRVHPETGKAHPLKNDRHHLSSWARAYERECGHLLCPQREARARAREQAKAQNKPLPKGSYVDNTLAECWIKSLDGKSFKQALEAKGWGLAKGDRKDGVLMVVTPSGRAFSILRELNKGLPKGQKLKSADVERKLADLERAKIKRVSEVQLEIDNRKRKRKGEQSKGQPYAPERPRRARRTRARPTTRTAQHTKHPPAPANDEGKAWALEMTIRAKQRALQERHEQERDDKNEVGRRRLERAKEEAERFQRLREQEQRLQDAKARQAKGGLLYRMSQQAREDAQDIEHLPDEINQSRERVEGWIAREQEKVRVERERLWDRQAKERQDLELRIEQARAQGEWKEAHEPSKESSDRTPSKDYGQGRGR